jgi:hypothetical protein
MSANPFPTAAERLNRNVMFSAARGLREKLMMLSATQAREEKIEYALEEGRCFGMRKMRSEMVQQRNLNKLLRGDPLTAKSWD